MKRPSGKFMKIKIISFIVLFLIGCGGDKSSNVISDENIIVYVSKGKTQCNDDGLSPDESTLVLVGAGIDVIGTFCGMTTGFAFPAVCGGATSDIIAHEIREVNLPSAIELGYDNIETLIDVENLTGYEISDCEDV